MSPATPAPTDDVVWKALAPAADGLTAAEVARRAQRRSPAVAVADAQVEVQVAQTRRTLARYLPRLGASASYRRTNELTFDFSGGGAQVGAQTPGLLQIGPCPGGAGGSCILDSAGLPVGAIAGAPLVIPQNNYEVAVNLVVPISDYALSLLPARLGAQADEAAARLQREADWQQVGANARIAFYDWARALAQLAVARRSLANAQARLQDAEKGLEVGTLTSVDVMAMRSLEAASRAALVQAESFARLAEKNLMILGDLKKAPALGEDLSAPVPEVSSLGALPELIARGQTERAEVQALAKAHEASKHGARATFMQALPRLDVVANVTHANPNPSYFPPGPVWNTSWFIGGQLTWQLDGAWDARIQLRQVNAQSGLLAAQRASMLEAIEVEVRAAWEEGLRAAEVARISVTEWEAAEATYQQRSMLYSAGEATSTDVVEAALSRHNATLRHVSARIDQRIALTRLRRAAALPFPDGGDSPSPASAKTNEGSAP